MRLIVGGVIGIVGMMSYGTRVRVEYGLGAEGLVYVRLCLCCREDSLAAVGQTERRSEA